MLSINDNITRVTASRKAASDTPNIWDMLIYNINKINNTFPMNITYTYVDTLIIHFDKKKIEVYTHTYVVSIEPR